MEKLNNKDVKMTLSKFDKVILTAPDPVVKDERKRLTYQDLIEIKKKMDTIRLPVVRNCPVFRSGMKIRSNFLSATIIIVFVDFENDVVRMAYSDTDHSSLIVVNWSVFRTIWDFQLGNLWLI